MAQAGEVGRPGPARTLRPTATGSSRRCSSGTSSSASHSGMPVVRSCQLWRPGWESSNSVGSASRPMSGALVARPPRKSVFGSADDLHRTTLSSVRTKPSTSAPGPPLGHGHQQAVLGLVVRDRPVTVRRRPGRPGPVRPGIPRRPAGPRPARPGNRQPHGELAHGRRGPGDAVPPHREPASTPGRSASPGHTAAPPRADPRCPASPAGRRRRSPSGSGWCRRSMSPSPAGCPARGPQGGHVGPGALQVDRLAHQAPRQAADVLLGHGEQAEIRSAEAQGGSQRLPLPHHDIGPPLPRGPQQSRTPPGRPPRPAARRWRHRCGGRRRGPPDSPDSSGTRRPARRAPRPPSPHLGPAGHAVLAGAPAPRRVRSRRRMSRAPRASGAGCRRTATRSAGPMPPRRGSPPSTNALAPS